MELIQMFPRTLSVSNIVISPDELSYLTKDFDLAYNEGNQSSIKNDILEAIELTDLKYKIEKEFNKHLQEIYCPKEKDLRIYITQSWLNVTTQGEYHHTHHHPNSVLSGVFYIDVGPEDSIALINAKDYLPIVFTSIKNSSINSSEFLVGNFTSGDFLVFSSMLRHYVPNKKGAGTRISLGINTFFKGTVGEASGATRLTL
jgi:uncharacterized protein (TIGR02466 family)